MDNNKINIFNLCIIIYNFLSVLSNRTYGYISKISVIILAFNFFVTINNLKNNNNNNNTLEKMSLIVEVVTALVILSMMV